MSSWRSGPLCPRHGFMPSVFQCYRRRTCGAGRVSPNAGDQAPESQTLSELPFAHFRTFAFRSSFKRLNEECQLSRDGAHVVLGAQSVGGKDRAAFTLATLAIFTWTMTARASLMVPSRSKYCRCDMNQTVPLNRRRKRTKRWGHWRRSPATAKHRCHWLPGPTEELVTASRAWAISDV